MLFFKKNLLFISNYLYVDTCSTIKKKIKNKTHIETSIYETYIVKEISIFTLYYFESHLRTIINHILRNNVDGELS